MLVACIVASSSADLQLESMQSVGTFMLSTPELFTFVDSLMMELAQVKNLFRLYLVCRYCQQLIICFLASLWHL